MNRQQILEQTLEVFKTVFGDSRQINENASADTIDRWDSLNHITLIQELEKKFGIRFNLFEIIEIRDVKGIAEYVFSNQKE